MMVLIWLEGVAFITGLTVVAALENTLLVLENIQEEETTVTASTVLAVSTKTAAPPPGPFLTS